MRLSLPLAVSLVLASTAFAQKDDDPSRAHIKLYKKVAPAVVLVQGGGNRTGSGVIIDKSGIVITSSQACGQTDTVTVTTKGHVQHKGRVIGRVTEKELAVVKIDGSDYPCVELGDSDAVRVGQTSYVFGDCWESIKLDDEPAMSLGVISGTYEITREKSKGYSYKGVVLETSAAVNQNQNGGPLVDREGKILGLVTLNYEESKFTGIAIPINVLKKEIERIRKEFEGGVAVAPGGGWLGLEIEESKGAVRISKVNRKGPADAAGLKVGDTLKTVGGKEVADSKKFGELASPLKPGDSVKVKIARNGRDMELTITAGKKPVY